MAESALPEPVRDRDAVRLRGLGGDVSVLRAVRRRPPRRRREPVLVLELDALPGADACFRRRLHRRPVPGRRRLAEPGLRRPAGDGDRLPDRQRVRLHLGQPRLRPGEDRRARRVLPAPGKPLLPELGGAVRPLEGEDGGADRRDHRPAGAGAPRVRAGRGHARRRPPDRVLRGARRLRPHAPLRRPDVATPLRVLAARLRRLHRRSATSARASCPTSPSSTSPRWSPASTFSSSSRARS